MTANLPVAAPVTRPVAMIAAVAANGVIGDGDRIPWRLSTDMRRFKHITMGKPVIMGRRTFATLPAPLAGRRNMMVSRQRGLEAAGAEIFASLEAALEAARTPAPAGDNPEIMIIGGGEIYRQAMDLAQRLYITHVELSPDGDSHFPAIDPVIWEVERSEDVPAGDKDNAASRFVIYRRRGG